MDPELSRNVRDWARSIQHHADGLVLELLRERLCATQLSFPSELPQL
jgi:hypothetical protein